jgi:hypothetical protein
MDLKRAVWPLFVLIAILFYSILLFAPDATIHWDLADAAYPVQKYISDSIAQRVLPDWTPFAFSGTPLLADPQSGFWYPLHWPFFLLGIVPRSLAWELALHSFLAMSGAYLLSRRLFGEVAPAVLAGVLYGFGGYFAAHSTDLALFEAAALLPWLLWAALEAVECGGRERFAFAGLIGGLVMLTGSIDGAAYCFFALACVLGACLLEKKRRGPAAAVAVSIALGAALIGAIVWIPWIGVAPYVTRTGLVSEGLAHAALPLHALGTVISADALGLISGRLEISGDPRQTYFYCGLLALPLALAGLLHGGQRAKLLALILPALWYAAGPAAGLAKLLGFIPAFRDARAPVEIWFVAALGLALAASHGLAWIVERTGRPRMALVLIVLALADLWFWNFYKNPMVLARVSFESLYGRGLNKFEQAVKSVKDLRFSRVFSMQPAPSLGPMDSALVLHQGVTYGHNLLQLNRHAEYIRELPSNPALLNTLATHAIDIRQGKLTAFPQALGFVSAPRNVHFVASPAEARAALSSLNPEQTAIAEPPQYAEHSALPQQVESSPADLRLLDLAPGSARVQYTLAGDALLRFSVPFAPGWNASIDGSPAPILATDYAFLGVLAPGGTHQLALAYRTSGFTAGSLASVTGLALFLALIFFPSRRTRSGR